MLITVHITNFHQWRELTRLVHEFATQTDKNFILQAWHDGLYHFDEDVFNLRGQALPIEAYMFNTWKEAPGGKYGYPLRNTAKDTVYTEYVTFTSADNQVLPILIAEVHKAINEQNHPDIIYWDTIHNQAINGKGEYQVLDTKLQVGHIDISSYCIKTELFRELGGFNENSICGDGELVVAATARGATSYKINKVLNVHN